MTLIRDNRCATLVKRHGFSEVGPDFTAPFEILFGFFTRPTPYYIWGMPHGDGVRSTVVFDPSFGRVWMKRQPERLNRPPFCFRNVTAEVFALRHIMKMLNTMETSWGLLN